MHEQNHDELGPRARTSARRRATEWLLVLVVDKFPGLAHSIQRGEIVVFNRVPADNDPATPVLVKRVIGLPGETISSKGDTVYINGRALKEPWLAAVAPPPTC